MSGLSLSSLLQAPNSSSTRYKAVVVATPSTRERAVPGAFEAVIVTASGELLEDILECCGSRDAGDSLNDPPGVGFWLWEGVIQATKGIGEASGEYDVEYKGAYRLLTDDELLQLQRGETLC